MIQILGANLYTIHDIFKEMYGPYAKGEVCEIYIFYAIFYGGLNVFLVILHDGEWSGTR